MPLRGSYLVKSSTQSDNTTVSPQVLTNDIIVTPVVNTTVSPQVLTNDIIVPPVVNTTVSPQVLTNEIEENSPRNVTVPVSTAAPVTKVQTPKVPVKPPVSPTNKTTSIGKVAKSLGFVEEEEEELPMEWE